MAAGTRDFRKMLRHGVLRLTGNCLSMNAPTAQSLSLSTLLVIQDVETAGGDRPGLQPGAGRLLWAAHACIGHLHIFPHACGPLIHAAFPAGRPPGQPAGGGAGAGGDGSGGKEGRGLACHSPAGCRHIGGLCALVSIASQAATRRPVALVEDSLPTHVRRSRQPCLRGCAATPSHGRLPCSCANVAQVHQLSRLYESAPAYVTDQPPFLNAAALVETCLPPLDLLRRLKDIEVGLIVEDGGSSRPSCLASWPPGHAAGSAAARRRSLRPAPSPPLATPPNPTGPLAPPGLAGPPGARPGPAGAALGPPTHRLGHCVLRRPDSDRGVGLQGVFRSC